MHAHIAGATVLRGEMGYGIYGKVHHTRLFGVSDDRPIVIVAVDAGERIRAVLPELRSLVKSGAITLQAIGLA